MTFLKIPVILCVKGGRFTVEGGNLTISNKEAAAVMDSKLVVDNHGFGVTIQLED